MLKRAEWKQQCIAHSSAARSLIAAGRFSSAYYLAGLAVECALKAKIARAFKASTWPKKAFVNSIHDHNITKLVGLADLESELATKCGTASFKNYWKTVSGWKNESKYEQWSEAEARDMVRASLGQSGVVSWIKKHW